MGIDLILESGVAGDVYPLQSIQHNRRAIRHDETRPDQQRSPLPVRDLGVVLTQQSRTLRNE